MSNERIARRYAIALVALVNEQKNSDSIAENLNFVNESISQSADLKRLLSSPIINIEKKKNIIEEIFSTKIDNVSLQYLFGVIKSGRADIILDVLSSFSNLQDELKNFVKVEIKTASEFTLEQEKELISKLEKITNKKIKPTYKIDLSLKGGFVVKIGDYVLDTSIKNQIEKLRERFLNAEFSRN